METRKILYEACVLCNKQTNVRADTDINNRTYYIEGCGQLCRECYRETYSKTFDELIHKPTLTDDYEVCAICQKKTNVKKSTNVIYRNEYVYGVGQLCHKCYMDTYKK